MDCIVLSNINHMAGQPLMKRNSICKKLEQNFPSTNYEISVMAMKLSITGGR